MKQVERLSPGRTALGSSSKSDRICLVLELGLAIFIGLCALQLHHLLMAASP
ncbi:hypothetical protein [Bosea sp. AS-1]|jgi:hypothetical protein|uniref:hypothetical protein n=1 Tax=Bosea sp. AS-1 TaxID=2015316 RepID=UPI0012FE65D4|nr:hypothetical protein [Bosea sp. AS-1]